MAWPTTKTEWVDGVTELLAAWFNDTEDRIGIPGSSDTESLTYKLTHSESVDPGHKHTAGAFTGGANGDVFFKDPADNLWKPVALDTAGIVAKTGAQTVAGIKTFLSIPILPASDPTTANEATRKAYVDGLIAQCVAKFGDTMSGSLDMGGHDITGVDILAAATAQLANPLAVGYGGTGLATVAAGDLLYASAVDTLAALTKAATGSVLLSGDAPAWGKVGLTTHVDGILPVANGGTGASDGWTTAQDPGHKHSKLFASDGDPEAVSVDAAGNVSLAKQIITAAVADLAFSGLAFVGTAGEDLALGDVCYLKSDGKYWLAKADVAATRMPGAVMATAAISAAATGFFLQKGFIRNDAWGAWTEGGLIYVTITGTTGNTVSQTAPVASGNIVQVIGYAYAAKVLFFDPNLTQVEIA